MVTPESHQVSPQREAAARRATRAAIVDPILSVVVGVGLGGLTALIHLNDLPGLVGTFFPTLPVVGGVIGGLLGSTSNTERAKVLRNPDNLFVPEFDQHGHDAQGNPTYRVGLYKNRFNQRISRLLRQG